MTQTPNGPKPNAGEVTQILNFLKEVVDKFTLRDISLLLHPCCRPVVTFDTFSCTSDNTAWGILFENVTVTFRPLAGQTVTLILTSTDNSGGGGAIAVVELDAAGSWTGNLQSSWWNSDGEQTVTLSIIGAGSRVVSSSEPQELTGLPNCD